MFMERMVRYSQVINYPWVSTNYPLLKFLFSFFYMNRHKRENHSFLLLQKYGLGSNLQNKT